MEIETEDAQTGSVAVRRRKLTTVDDVMRKLQADVEQLSGTDNDRRRRRCILRGARAVLIAQDEGLSPGAIETVLRVELFARR